MFYRLFLSAALFIASDAGQDLHVSGEKIRAHVKYLASDELDGRGVGTTGEKLATEYITAQLKAEGVSPGGANGTYYQRVPLVASTTLPDATLTITGANGRQSLAFVK